MADPGICVIATDLTTGERGEASIKPGNFVCVCAEPLYVAGEQRYANGTIIVTLRTRAVEPQRPSEVP